MIIKLILKANIRKVTSVHAGETYLILAHCDLYTSFSLQKVPQPTIRTKQKELVMVCFPYCDNSRVSSQKPNNSRSPGIGSYNFSIVIIHFDSPKAADSH